MQHQVVGGAGWATRLDVEAQAAEAGDVGRQGGDGGLHGAECQGYVQCVQRSAGSRDMVHVAHPVQT